MHGHKDSSGNQVALWKVQILLILAEEGKWLDLIGAAYNPCTWEETPLLFQDIFSIWFTVYR